MENGRQNCEEAAVSHQCECASHQEHHHEKPPKSRTGIIGKNAARFLGWFFGFAGLYVMGGGPCPFCGAQGCPVGTAGAGFMGFVFAALMKWGKLIRSSFSNAMIRILQIRRSEL
jgi:hypothetical protein